MRVSRLAPIATTLVLAVGVGSAQAVYEAERYQIQGDFSVQSSFHHKSVENIDYVQQRQELQLGGIWRAITQSDEFPLLKKVDFSMLWRGRYDPIFDIRDRYKRRGYDRDTFRFPEGDHPREVYADFEFRGALEDLSIRVGRQQLVWGEADFFRSLDVINPLRLDQMSLVGDDLDKYREPLWMARFLYSVGNLPYVSQVLIETFYSPDGRPLTNDLVLGNGWRIFDNVLDGSTQRPHKVPFDQVRHPWEIERVGPEYATAPDQGDLGIEKIAAQLGLPLGSPLAGGVGKADFVYLGNRPYGDDIDLSPDGWHEIDPHNRSMGGARIMGQTATGGLYFTLNYIYKRAEIPAPGIGWDTLFDPSMPGGLIPNVRADVLLETGANMNSPDLNGNGAPDGNEQALRDCFLNSEPKLIVGPSVGRSPDAPLGRTPYGYAYPTESLGAACVPIPLNYPYTHIFGFTGTYNDNDITGAILRTEQSISLGEPRTKRPALAGVRAGDFPRAQDFMTKDYESTDIWRSMVGFDYLAAVFGHHQVPRPLYKIKLIRSLMTDQWFFTFQFFNEYWSNVSQQLGQNFSLTNRHQHWNPILTWIMTGFFVNDKLRPTIALAYDMNAEFPVAWLQAQYYVTDELQVRVGEVAYLGSSHKESFLLLNKYSDRDTAYIRLTYFFL